MHQIKIEIAVCDDETEIAKYIAEKVQKFCPGGVIDVYASGEELLQSDKNYEIVFLDIEMPDIDGMEVARQLRDREFAGEIVFLTSYSEFMQEAFKVRAFRYLQKPVSDDDLFEVLHTVEREHAFCVETGTETIWIRAEDIVYIKADRNYTQLYLKKQVIETRKTLSEWMELIGESEFFRIHKSYVVSMSQIDRMNANFVVVKNLGARLPISRKVKPEFRMFYFRYMEHKGRCM